MVDRVAARLRNATDSEYVPLTQRVARAVRLPALGDRENPFHPLRYCRALGSAVDKLGFKGEERQAVVKAFEVPLQKPLVAVYSALNKRLEQQGVPDGEAVSYSNATAGVRAAAADGRAAAQPAHTAGAAAGAAANTGVISEASPAAASVSCTTAEQLLTALFQRMNAKIAGGIGGTVPAVPVPAMALDHRGHAGAGPDDAGFRRQRPVGFATRCRPSRPPVGRAGRRSAFRSSSPRSTRRCSHRSTKCSG